MKVIRDRLRVNVNRDSVGGAKPEPEELTATRELTVESPVVMGSNGKPLGKMAAPPEVHMEGVPLGGYAQGEREACVFCRWWSREAWRRYLAYLNDPSSPKAARAELNKLRFRLLSGGMATIDLKRDGRKGSAPETKDAEFDVENVLAGLGICMPASEVARDPFVTFPQGFCPVSVYPKDAAPGTQVPFPKQFVPRGNAEERAASEVFDRIMLDATKMTRG